MSNTLQRQACIGRERLKFRKAFCAIAVSVACLSIDLSVSTAAITPEPATHPASLSPTSANDDPAGFEARKSFVLECHRDDTRYDKSPKVGLPAALVKLYLTHGTDPAALEYASNVMDYTNSFDHGPNGVIYGELFTYPGLARFLCMYGDKLSPVQLAHLKSQLVLRGQDLLLHGTENHAIMRISSGYLYCQYFPGVTWQNEHGAPMTSEQMMAETKRLLLQRGKGFFRAGNNEALSTTYGITNIYPLLNLIDFAKDPEVKNAAEALALYQTSELALNDFKGHIIPPFNRENSQQEQFGEPPAFSGRHNVPLVQQLLWLYFGQNRPIAEDFTHAVEPSFNVFFALSNWRTPDIINRIALGEGTPYAIRSSLPLFGLWGTGSPDEALRSVWRDKEFAVGAMPLQQFDPENYFLDYDPFDISWSSSHRFNYVQTSQPYWRSNAGEDHWEHGVGSPFEQSAQHKNTAIVLFNIPEKDPWRGRGQARFTTLRDKHYDHLLQVGQCRFPKSVDQLVVDGDWYFLRDADVYIGVRALKPGSVLKTDLTGGGMDDFDEIKSYSGQTGFVFEVGTRATRGTFKDFCEKLKANPLTVDWNTLQVGYTNTDGDRLSMQYDSNVAEDADHVIKLAPKVKVNDLSLDVDHWPVTESPVVNLKDNVLDIGNGPLGAGHIRVDWRGAQPVISR